MGSKCADFRGVPKTGCNWLQPVRCNRFFGGLFILKSRQPQPPVRSLSVRFSPVFGLFSVHTTGPSNTIDDWPNPLIKQQQQEAWDEFVSRASKACLLFLFFFFTLPIFLHRSILNTHHQLYNDTATYHNEWSLHHIQIAIKPRETRTARRATTRGRGSRRSCVLSPGMFFLYVFFLLIIWALGRHKNRNGTRREWGSWKQGAQDASAMCLKPQVIFFTHDTLV